jgi:hypothetical protein
MYLFERFKELRKTFSLEDMILVFTKAKAEWFETRMIEERRATNGNARRCVA